MTNGNNSNKASDDKAMELRDDFLMGLAEALESGRWMAAVWCIEENKIKLKKVVTYKFPASDFLAAIGHLSLTAFEEVKQMQMREAASIPLPPIVDSKSLEPKE